MSDTQTSPRQPELDRHAHAANRTSDLAAEAPRGRASWEAGARRAPSGDRGRVRGALPAVVALAAALAACGPPATVGEGGADSVAADTGSATDGGLDAGTVGTDAGATDSTTADASGPDATMLDAAAPDASPVDAGAPDAGAVDAGADVSQVDVGCVLLPPAVGPAPGDGACKTALRCAAGDGCRDGACGACTSADDCRDREGCVDGSCGRCAADGACRGGERCSHGFCVPQVLQVWEIGVDSADWATFWADPYAKNLVPCTLTVDGTAYEGCQVRIRGGNTVDFPKKSFRIELPGGGPTPGYAERINLRAEYNDGSYLRNLLTMETISRLTRLPAPRVRPVRVSLNGSDHGVMLEVERVADPMLTARGWAKDQPLVEADPPWDLASKGACSLVPLSPSVLYGMAYDVKGNGATGTLEALVSLVEDVIWKDYEDRLAGAPHPVRANAAVDMELLADYVAVLALVQSTDHLRKNYYLSRQSANGGRWIMLPWDLDLTFGCLWSPEHETLCIDQVVDTPWTVGALPAGVGASYPVDGLYNLLIDLAIADGAWSQRIRGRLCAMIDDPAWTSDIPDMSLALEEAMAPVVAEDTGDRNETVDDFHAAADTVRSFVEQRRAFLRQSLDCGACGAGDFY